MSSKKLSAYIQLCKPKVVLLMLLSTWVGMTVHAEITSIWIMLYGLLGIGFIACAGGIINHITDQSLDQHMSRTRNRPLIRGHVQPKQAIFLSIILTLLGAFLLFWGTNERTMLLTLFALIGYTVIYSKLLKTASPQNIVIGGLSGAMPPALGWSVTHHQLTAEPWLMVLVIFLWTPAHFWSLAIYKQQDYAKVNLPMLPMTHGEKLTILCLLGYMYLTLLSCWLPWLSGLCSWRFAVIATLFNLSWCVQGHKLYRSQTNAQALICFKYSIIQLYGVFLAWLIDSLW